LVAMFTMVTLVIMVFLFTVVTELPTLYAAILNSVWPALYDHYFMWTDFPNSVWQPLYADT
jgi:hypothetical protein